MLAVVLGVSLGWSQDFITDVGETSRLGLSGTWSRVLYADGWKIAMGTQDHFWLSDLERSGEGWALVGERTDLQDRADLKDHALVACPDGTWLHVASANVTAPNDSAYAWRLSADFEIVASATIEEGATERMHNDMVIMCSRLASGAMFPASGSDGERGNAFFPLDDELAVGDIFTVEDLPRAEGGALLTDAEADIIYQTGSDEFGQNPVVRTYDAGWVSTGYHTLQLVDSPLRAYWPQRLMQLGDYFLLAFVARDDRGGNGDEGNIYVAVLDAQWRVLQRVQVTDYPENAGFAMRPWMARRGQTLMVSFDAETEHSVAELTLDPAAFGLSEDDLYADTAWSPHEAGDSASGSPASPARGGCGSRPTRGAAIVLTGALLGLLARRRPWPARRRGA